MSTLTERISIISEKEGTTIGAIERKIGASKGVLSRAISNGTDIQAKWVQRIVENYPQYSPLWILTGEGSMQSGPYCRINHILKLEGITEREFARGSGDIGFVFPIVYDFAKKNPGNPRILHQWIQAVINRFPKYSEDWILNGEGEMLKDILPISAGKSFPQKADRNVDMQDVPLYDFDATAGLMALFNDRQVEAADFLRIPNLPPVDGAVYVRGESMTPLLKSGDIVIYKKKAVAIDSILWGEIYLLSFDCDGDSYTAVKYIQKSEDPTKVRLVSFNPSFAPKDIPMESITALALVKASITFHTME